MTHSIIAPRKLIEVALPLAEINEAAAREKSIRHGHPSTLHLWWARRPLAAARAVIFSQMVNDPSWKYSDEELALPGIAAKVEAERERLFGILRELVKWESTTKEEVLEPAREEIRKSWRETCGVNKDHPEAASLFNPDKLPAFHDPFAGGGALPLEAQRLGLEAWASDLNPVAVLINKAMIEIPPMFAGGAPVGPEPKDGEGSGLFDKWPGATGLAEDVRRYGAWMREEAEKRIGHLYPKVKGPDGDELTVIAWIWARTVKSPNPAFSHVDVPLVRSFNLSTKKGKEVWIEPVVMGDRYEFKIRHGGKPKFEGTVKRTGATCIMSGIAMPFSYVRTEGKRGKMGRRLMAIVAEGNKGRVYLEATSEHEKVADSARPVFSPDMELPFNPRDFKTPNYGLTKFSDLFTPRQLVALSTFSDLVGEARERVYRDAVGLGNRNKEVVTSEIGLEEISTASSSASHVLSPTSHPRAYADAVAVYLAFAVDKGANLWSSNTSWMSDRGALRETFARQAIPMVWDFAEANPFSESGGNFLMAIEKGAMAISNTPAFKQSYALQQEASTQDISTNKVISTDPPYYDNIGYADLSDYFYIWLRRSQAGIQPKLFTTIAVPKIEELVATPYRHGGKENADRFFLNGMSKVIGNLYRHAEKSFPVTIYYAFKQGERVEEGAPATGWETFLTAVIQSGYSIQGTWPVRTEGVGRILAKDTNALASSVVLVCRRREAGAATTTRKAFLAELRRSLKSAKATLTAAHLAPVDLAQSLIGPGMASYSKYSKILEPDGSAMTVHTALALINREIGGDWDFDPATRFCMDWYLQFGFEPGEYGQAELLSKAKNVDIKLLSELGLLVQKGGKVRLIKREELGDGEKGKGKTDARAALNPNTLSLFASRSQSLWEALQRLVRAIRTTGEEGAASLLRILKVSPEDIRDLAYELYTLCDRKGGLWREEAGLYNQLIVSWPEITKLEATMKGSRAEEGELDFEVEEDEGDEGDSE